MLIVRRARFGNHPSHAGVLRAVANAVDEVDIVVYARLNANVYTTVRVYSNLKAAELDIDFASDMQRISTMNALEAIAEGETLSLKVYVTSTSVAVVL